MRLTIPFNNRCKIIWNENGRSGMTYKDGTEDTFEHTKINTALTSTGIGAVTQLLLFPLKPF